MPDYTTHPWTAATSLVALLLAAQHAAAFHTNADAQAAAAAAAATAAVKLTALAMLLLLANVLVRQVLLRTLLSYEGDDLLVRCALIFFPSTSAAATASLRPGPTPVSRQTTTGGGALRASITTHELELFEDMRAARPPKDDASAANEESTTRPSVAPPPPQFRSSLFVDPVNAARIALPPIAAFLHRSTCLVLAVALAVEFDGEAVVAVCHVAFLDAASAETAAAFVGRVTPSLLRLSLLARALLPLDSAVTAIANDLCTAYAITPAGRQGFSFVAALLRGSAWCVAHTYRPHARTHTRAHTHTHAQHTHTHARTHTHTHIHTHTRTHTHTHTRTPPPPTANKRHERHTTPRVRVLPHPPHSAALLSVQVRGGHLLPRDDGCRGERRAHRMGAPRLRRVALAAARRQRRRECASCRTALLTRALKPLSDHHSDAHLTLIPHSHQPRLLSRRHSQPTPPRPDPADHPASLGERHPALHVAPLRGGRPDRRGQRPRPG